MRLSFSAPYPIPGALRRLMNLIIVDVTEKGRDYSIRNVNKSNQNELRIDRRTVPD